MRFLLDTDIGDDIDDALALALALRLPNVELVGVTTVFRDTYARARMTRHILDISGHSDIPVYAGSGKPLLGALSQEPHEAQLDMTPDDVSNPPSTHAVDVIRATYAQPGSDITLVTIGPLTNLALALALDPTLAERIPRVVTMGGHVGRAQPEWNILCDAEAAAIVFRSGLPITLVPIDVTQKTEMRTEHLDRFAASTDSSVQWLLQLTRAWQHKTRRLPMLHDPLAIATAFDPSWVETERFALDVVTAAGPGRGITCIMPDATPAIDVALRVDGPHFVDWFTEQVAGS